jgi:hypothetical protein
MQATPSSLSFLQIADADGSLNNLTGQLKNGVREMIRSSRDYFERTVMGKLAGMVAFLKSCRLANPYTTLLPPEFSGP